MIWSWSVQWWSYKGFNAFLRCLIQEYLQRENHLYRKTFYTCLSRLYFKKIIQSCLEIREATEIRKCSGIGLQSPILLRKCSGIGLQSPILLSFPFLSGSIYRTMPPTLCILYLLLIQSIPLMENIVQLLGWG